MDLLNVTSITTGGGAVSQIVRTSDNVILWTRLPNEYQEVEWIGTDGNSYFVSDFTINNLDKFTVYYTYSSPETINNFMFGASAAASNSTRFLHRYQSLVANTDASSGGVSVFGFMHDNSFQTYKIICEHEGEIQSWYNDVMQTRNPFYNRRDFIPFGVFCNNYRNLVTSYKAVSESKISELRFVNDDTGVDVFNPVPCYHKADGVIGMYDTVSENFYINEEAGSFTKGSDI